MAWLGATELLRGYGLSVVGADREQRAPTETAALREHLHDATLERMNAGATLDEILHTVHAPPELLERPYLRPVYDEPEFVVRNVWRLYGGWHDGNPSRLKPAPDAAVAAEVAALAGGPARLAARALDTHDLLVFDPRGVGKSSPVLCDPATVPAAFAPVSTPPSPDGFAAIAGVNTPFFESCFAATGELMKHLSSMDTAADIERIRQALTPNDGLVAIAGSYGTTRPVVTRCCPSITPSAAESP